METKDGVKDWRIPDEFPTTLTYLLAGEDRLETEEAQWLVEDYLMPYVVRVLDRFTVELSKVAVSGAAQIVILGCLKRALDEMWSLKE